MQPKHEMGPMWWLNPPQTEAEQKQGAPEPSPLINILPKETMEKNHIAATKHKEKGIYDTDTSSSESDSSSDSNN